MNTPLPTRPLSGAVRLNHLGLIRARGADAVKFLQGQLTNDVVSLRADEARLAGFCSAKGRLQASFIVWRADAADELLLACAASLLPATQKRLSMFVLRAQCKLSDASAELPLWGVSGGDDVEPGLAVWQTRRSGDGGWSLRLPDVAGQRRALSIAAEPPARPALSLDTWRWLEVESGIATIEAATVEQFVPQMLNFELIGGVDFSKGCYPGQEVVARSQYRGTLKRRSFLFDVDAPAVPGQEVFHAADPAQPAGRVVNAAPRPDSNGHGFSALVEIKLAALVGGELHLGQADGPLLRRQQLPYAVPADSAELT